MDKAQRELQEERDRSKRLVEAARAGSMATQGAGTSPVCVTWPGISACLWFQAFCVCSGVDQPGARLRGSQLA